MDVSIPLNSELSLEKMVGNKDTAAHYGSGHLEVLATPALIAFMENVSLKLAQKYLPEELDTVGTLVNIKHVKATLAGNKVRCTSRLEHIDGKKLTFKVTAWDEEAEIGHGVHERYIVDPHKFLERLTKK